MPTGCHHLAPTPPHPRRWPFHDRHSHVVLSTVDALDEIGAYVVLCSYEPVPEALEPHADACHPDPRRVLASVQRGSAALVEPVFPHEVPEKARDIHLKYQNRGAAAEEDLVAGDPDSVKAGGGAVPQGGSVKERRRRRRGGKRGKGVKPDWSGSVSAERLKAMYGDREGRLRDGVTPGTRVR